jgi:murein DD-endopeptidase MepM/ murein hydrolase activator NlpD
MLPLLINKIRTDGPNEARGNSFGKVRNHGATWHRGWDFDAPVGTPVVAVAPGTVIHAYPHVNGYGRCLVLRFKNPRYQAGLKQSVGIENYKFLYALYAHLSKTDIGEKSEVEAGAQLGLTGSDGNASNEPPHLHFEVLLEDTLTKATPRVDPGELFGYTFYACGQQSVVNQELLKQLRGR